MRPIQALLQHFFLNASVPNTMLHLVIFFCCGDCFCLARFSVHTLAIHLCVLCHGVEKISPDSGQLTEMS